MFDGFAANLTRLIMLVPKSPQAVTFRIVTAEAHSELHVGAPTACATHRRLAPRRVSATFDRIHDVGSVAPDPRPRLTRAIAEEGKSQT
jgi:hypothetical protein